MPRKPSSRRGEPEKPGPEAWSGLPTRGDGVDPY